MKQLIRIAIASIIIIFTTDSLSKAVANHKSTIASDEFIFISFVESSSGDYLTFNIYSEDWTSIGRFYKTFNGFLDSSYVLDVDEVKYETVFNENTGTSKSLLEVRDSTNSIPIAFFYSGEITRGDTTLSSTDINKFSAIQDTMNVHNNTNDSMPFTLGQQSVSQVAYPISFDEVDNYASGYTPGELAYIVEHDANGYKFELIQDTDRGNLLVGFRYKSGLDNNTYTKFIVPNN